LHHGDHHTAILTRIQVPVRSVLWDKHSVSSHKLRLLAAYHDQSFPFPTEHDLVSIWVTMKTVLLAWLEAVEIAVELI
jgi:hypothetical protein